MVSEVSYTTPPLLQSLFQASLDPSHVPGSVPVKDLNFQQAELPPQSEMKPREYGGFYAYKPVATMLHASNGAPPDTEVTHWNP